ncbi:primase C-terminal domain-containing protein [Jeotgalibacillus proteolyticus]|uniref:Primase C-terminal 1 domain-containing protein n=1 Tax=Jeotgalibacillus proteolyticus TaxID=2082395 RepID=A0A2S5G754_9BACL|nr:primase C-terminal domain-containing protein [Jeotgalibacillus proteolyticus]PPA68684.1 hypothetical protein C4B60_19115 [Jeotgalibacillus proteolyticus]PPA68761.1 hypothetical protein C4B60_19545 [Jeotgalibacillus proteolyticus]
MNVYRAIYKDQLTETPKVQSEKQQTGYSSHLGWIFVCNEFHEKPKSLRTYHSLYGALEAFTYYTPNTFYRRDQRHAGALRWLNAMVIDIDVKNAQNQGLILPDVLDAITAAGLPGPSLVVSTPSGGFHVYWYFNQAKRALPKVTDHYKRIQQTIAEVIQGDPQAVGAERWFRMPTNENTLYQSEIRVSFDDLCDWFSIHIEEQIEERKAVCVDVANLLHHAAVQKLLKGVSKGQRDNTCYTLALAFKAAGFTERETEHRLHDWNQKNDPAMSQLDVKRKVKSAFKKDAPPGPSAYWIRTLSGMTFTYQVWEDAKSREERKYSHFDEWEKDVLRYLKQQGGQVCAAQRSIAQAIKSSSDDTVSIPYSTFKKIVDHLIQIGMIIKDVKGKGRAAVTILTLKKNSKVVPFKRKDKPKNNGLNSNTFIDLVVGGIYLSLIFDRFFTPGDGFFGGVICSSSLGDIP